MLFCKYYKKSLDTYTVNPVIRADSGRTTVKLIACAMSAGLTIVLFTAVVAYLYFMSE